MRRCEKGEKLHFLQLSTEFFNEFSVRRLLRAPGGDTMLRIYMQAHCAALDTGGALQLHGDMDAGRRDPDDSDDNAILP